MYQKMVVVGNLTRDIELRYSASGTPIANCAIATTRKFTSNGERKEETMFIDISAFGKTAEIINQYLKKGSKLLIEGRLDFQQWVDQENNKRSKHVLIVETMQMMDAAPSSNEQSQGYTQQQQGYAQPQQQQPQQGYGQPQQQYAPPPTQYVDGNGRPITKEQYDRNMAAANGGN